MSVFHGLKYRSPLYTVPGVGTFRFTARYPTDADMLVFSGEFETILDRYAENGTPLANDDKERAQKVARRAELAALYARAALDVIEEADIKLEGGKVLTDWRGEFKADGRPGFVGTMLRAIGSTLFRGPTESDADASPVAEAE